MFAEDSGITAFYQMIDAISTFKFDSTSMALFYSSETLEDFVLVEDLVQNMDHGNLSLNFIPYTAPDGWFPKGKIHKDMLSGSTPEPGKIFFLQWLTVYRQWGIEFDMWDY
jgi:hypothetical protein